MERGFVQQGTGKIPKLLQIVRHPNLPKSTPAHPHYPPALKICTKAITISRTICPQNRKSIKTDGKACGRSSNLSTEGQKIFCRRLEARAYFLLTHPWIGPESSDLKIWPQQNGLTTHDKTYVTWKDERNYNSCEQDAEQNMLRFHMSDEKPKSS